MALRPLGWGCRIGFFLTSVIFCIISATRDVNPIHEYTLSRERDSHGALRNSNTDLFEGYVYFVFAVWSISIFLEAMSFLVGRGSLKPHSGQCYSFPAFLLNRVSIGGDDDDGRCFVALLLMVWFLGLAFAATLCVFTVIGHGYVTRNPFMIAFFGLLIAFEVLSALADACTLGGIDGYAVSNRPASWLISLRVIVVVPVQVITSVFFMWMCQPS
tara:strand:+ start:740 stop:1384 length:645 start_codon:yes stop_codon:yes gene_type:complete